MFRFASLVMLLVLGGCASLPDNTARVEAHYVKDPQTRLAKAVEREAADHPGLSGFHLLGDGLDAFAARVLAANAAERTIDVQYYLFHDDLTGGVMMERLLAAADRGVRVRLLLDDIATAGYDLDLAALDDHPNVEVRLFNPFANRGFRYLEMVSRFGRVTRRMHNKSFTVDGVVTIVGGRNIGDEYFAADPSVEFGDLDVLAAGPVAEEVSSVFDRYWNSELAYPASQLSRGALSPGRLQELRVGLQRRASEARSSPYGRRIRHSTLFRDLTAGELVLHWGRAQVFADEPEKLLDDPADRSTHMGPRLRPVADAVSQELLIFSPYFVPGPQGVDWLVSLEERGVRVRVLTNSLASNDVGIVHAGYSKYRPALLRGGIELHEAKAQPERPSGDHGGVGSSSSASLHAKTFVFDRERLFVGSLNLDPRSAALNTEMGIVFHSPALARAVSDWADANLDAVAYELGPDPDDCRTCKGHRIRWIDHRPEGERVYFRDPETGPVRRLLIWFVRWLPIEGQL